MAAPRNAPALHLPLCRPAGWVAAWRRLSPIARTAG
jgi:hypothetical protein